MKILKQERKGNQAILEVEEEYSRLEPHLKEAYQEISKEVKIPGFRSGKIPMDVLKKYVNEAAVLDRAVQLLISETYPDVVADAKISPVDYPNVEMKKMEKPSPLIFSIKVDVYPEIKLGNYKGFKVTKKSAAVSDDEVQQTLEFIKTNYAKQNKIDGSSVALDDDFVKKISTFPTMAELRAMLKSNIEMEKKNDAEMSFRDDITKKLADVVESDIPGSMIEREIDTMVDDLAVSLKRNKMTIESYLSAIKKDKDKLRGDLHPAAESRVKAKLALEAIADKEKLVVEQNDIDKELEVLAKHAGKDLEEYKAELHKGAISSLKEYMLREKAIDFVVSKAKVEEETTIK